MNVKQLKEILETYPDEYLIVIDHIEGFVAPSLVQPIEIKPLDSDDIWKDYKGDYEIDTSLVNSLTAIHITLQE